MSDLVKRESETGIARTYKFEDLEKMAEVLAKSKMFGAWDTKDKVLALFLVVQAEKSHPCIAVQRFFPITNAQGQTAIGKWAKAMHIDFQSFGGEIEWLVTNAQEAKGLFTMPDRKPFTFGYTWAQAVRAKLVGKSNWTNHPDDMLRNTVIAKGLRAYHPASTSFMCSESEGLDNYDKEALTGGEAGQTGGEGEKKLTTPAQELFGVKGKGKKAKEEKVVECTVIVEPIQPCVESTKETIVGKAIADATIPPVEPKSEPEKSMEQVAKQAAEASEYVKLMKSLPQAKLLAFLVSIKYIKQGESYDKVSVTRQQHAVKSFAGFKAKVEAYVPFGQGE